MMWLIDQSFASPNGKFSVAPKCHCSACTTCESLDMLAHSVRADRLSLMCLCTLLNFVIMKAKVIYSFMRTVQNNCLCKHEKYLAMGEGLRIPLISSKCYPPASTCLFLLRGRAIHRPIVIGDHAPTTF
jgi:hypothetical protein